MAYRYGDRRQAMLFPQSIDQYIPPDSPVRAYDVFVDSLNFEQLGIRNDPRQVGCPQYDPHLMLKRLVYGYSYGFRSRRKLERECHYNLSFIWLAGGLKPDHKTIAQFRRHHRGALVQVLKQCARLCLERGLIEGNTLFIDGSKIRANASQGNSWTPERCGRHLEKIEGRIAEILTECEQADRTEQEAPSRVHMQEELADQNRLRAKVLGILQDLSAEGKASVNTTDPDCTKIHGRQGSHAGYNAQIVVDEKHGLIVSSDVVNENNDLHQFARQVEQAAETLEQAPQTACADSGYANVHELEKVDQQGTYVVVPTTRQACEKIPEPFDKRHFSYDSAGDCYICPEGKELHYSYTNGKKNRKEYLAKASECKSCRHWGTCTKSPGGRKITRLLKEELVQKLERQYEQPASQKIYPLRKQKAELPFGHIKYNLKSGQFLLRGFEGVRAEMAVLACCFNIARVISLMGVTGMISKLGY